MTLAESPYWPVVVVLLVAVAYVVSGVGDD